MGLAGWSFKKNGKVTSVSIEGQISVTVNEASTVAALAGLGIISTSYWSCREELEKGTLVQLLPEWEIGNVEVNALITGGRTAKPSARAFVDYLVSSFNEENN